MYDCSCSFYFIFLPPSCLSFVGGFDYLPGWQKKIKSKVEKKYDCYLLDITLFLDAFAYDGS